MRSDSPLAQPEASVAPLLFYVASAPVRERFKALGPAGLLTPGLDDMVAHVRTATLAMLAPSPPAHRRSSRSPKPTGRRRS